MDVAGLISSFSSGTYTVTRRAAATITTGRAVAGATSSVTITASVQPASGRDLQRLPEGRRAIETLTLFTTTQLLVGGQGAANEADLVTIGGKVYEVQLVETWPVTSLNAAAAYRALAQLRGS